MISIKKKNEAFELLKNYDGDNPYIWQLHKDVYVNKNTDAIGDFQAEYILKNYNFKPKTINKIVKIADWYGEKKKKDWELTDFTPKVLKIITLLGETETTYHCYVQYRQSVPPVKCFLPKNGILTNFLVEDYNKLEIDFERYSKLSNFQRILLPHQETAVKFLLSRKKCILADDQGLGKTTSLAVAAKEGNFDSVLIICPASLKYNWKRELSYFIPEKEITLIESFDGKKKAELEDFLGYAAGKSNMTREELIQECKEVGKWKDNRFVIINYDVLDDFFENKRTYNAAQFEQLLSESPMLQYINNRKSLIIIDEAHFLSNAKSTRYKTIRGLINKGKPDSIYLATGTPITNNPANLYSVLGLLNTDVTSDWEYFMKRYCDAKEFCKDKNRRNKFSDSYIHKKGKSSWYDLTSAEKDDLNTKLHELKPSIFVLSPQGDSNLDELKERISHIYLRRLKDILNLPKKTIHELYYELSYEQKLEYDELWEEYEREKKELDPEKEINKELLEGGIYRQYLSNLMVPNTIKLANEYIEKGEKVVIACCYDEELYKIQEYYGDRCVIFNGDLLPRQKDKTVEKFMTDPNTMVFIGNMKAAGVGITLVASHVLIFNDFDYVPGNNSQMSDRVHRIGQQHDVDIYYQIYNRTQYERMWNITLRKQTIIDTVIKTEDEK